MRSQVWRRRVGSKILMIAVKSPNTVSKIEILLMQHVNSSIIRQVVKSNVTRPNRRRTPAHGRFSSIRQVAPMYTMYVCYVYRHINVNHPRLLLTYPTYSPRHGRLSLRVQSATPAQVRSLSMNATKTLVQAFISCRLDYCNSLLYGISDGLLQRLQSVQNAAARLVTGTRRSDHITPVLRQLH